MITTIAKRFTFDAAHFIPTVPEGHKCRGMHGHTYGVELRFRGPTGATGFCRAIDYAEIAEVWKHLHDVLDHKVLNEIDPQTIPDAGGLPIPTTEHLVVWIMKAFNYVAHKMPAHDHLAWALHSVRVNESESTWCEATIEDLRR